jgi:hypothetical protein
MGREWKLEGAGTAPLVNGIVPSSYYIRHWHPLSHFECRKDYVYLWSSHSQVCECYIFLMKPELELVSEMYLSTHFVNC